MPTKDLVACTCQLPPIWLMHGTAVEQLVGGDGYCSLAYSIDIFDDVDTI